MPGWLKVYMRVAVQTAVLAGVIAGAIRGYIVWHTGADAQPPPADRFIEMTVGFALAWTLLLGAMHIAAVRGARRVPASATDYDLPQRRTVDLVLSTETAFAALKRAVMQTAPLAIEQSLPTTGRLTARTPTSWKGRVTLTAELHPRGSTRTQIALEIGLGLLSVVDEGQSYALIEDLVARLKAATT